MIVLRASVSGLVGGTVLDHLAVRANADVGVREDRGQRCKRYREPCERQVPTQHHQVMAATDWRSGSIDDVCFTRNRRRTMTVCLCPERPLRGSSTGRCGWGWAPGPRRRARGPRSSAALHTVAPRLASGVCTDRAAAQRHRDACSRCGFPRAPPGPRAVLEGLPSAECSRQRGLPGATRAPSVCQAMSVQQRTGIAS
jgi:hypothetical protein